MLNINDIVDGKYKIIKPLGQGGMGSVFLAQHLKLETYWAVKEINLSANNKINLLAEPEILKRLNHPSLPRIIDIITADDSLLIIEDYFEGVPLHKLIEAKGRVPETDLLKWAKQLAEILDYLHTLKPPIVYLDMKPSNIIIDAKGNAKLIDFGISKEYTIGNTDTIKIGTRGYAAPEQCGKGNTDVRTDIYSLGMTFYHAISGKVPSGDILPVKEMNPDVSKGFDNIITKCIKREPIERYQTVKELIEDLNNFHKFSREYRTNKIKKLAIVGSLLVGLTLFGYLYLDNKNQIAADKVQHYNNLIEKGMDFLRKEDFVEAEKSIQQAIKLDSTKGGHINLAQIYLRKNENKKAIEVILEAINSGFIESDGTVKYILGTAYFNLADYEKSVWYLKEAIDGVVPELRYEVLRDLAVSYGKLGDYHKAEEVLAQIAADSDIKKDLIHYLQGELFALKGDYGASLAAFEKANNMDQTNIRYKLSMADLYLTLNQQSGVSFEDKYKNFQKALNLLVGAEKVDRSNIVTLTKLGQVHYDFGLLYESQQKQESKTMFAEALIAFNKIIDMGLEDVNLYVNVGMLNAKLGKINQAEKAYQKALQLDSDDSRANLVYGLFHVKQKRYAEAYKYLSKTVAINKNPAEVSSAKAVIAELKSKGWIN